MSIWRCRHKPKIFAIQGAFQLDAVIFRVPAEAVFPLRNFSEFGRATLLFESAARFGAQRTKGELLGRPWRRD